MRDSMNEKYSLLFPFENISFKTLSSVAMHDLALDSVIKAMPIKESEQNMIMNVLSKVTNDPSLIEYRCDVFDDIYKNPSMREELLSILDKINFLHDYGGFSREYDESATVWDLMHRLDEINDYIKCVDALHECLQNKNLSSKGLIGLREYVEKIYSENGFSELKKDISKLNLDTSELKSITLGVNLNDRFEAVSIGLVSINNKYFTKSGVISNFCDHLSKKDQISNSTEWNNDYKYDEVTEKDVTKIGSVLNRTGAMYAAMQNPIFAAYGVAAVAEGDSTKDSPVYLNRVVNTMISGMVKRLKEVLNRYVSVTITNMTDLIPELLFYVRFAELIEKLSKNGATFSKAEVIKEGNFSVKAQEIYNIKLLLSQKENSDSIVTNDFYFDNEHRLYILTGANRGGKTTITQTVGQLFVLAQSGIYIPGKSFLFSPVDSVFTHFPADEDKTFDLGRLGEECKRFKDIFKAATEKSLILMNETFSTTSFEEGYFIARDSVKALLKKGVRTIYNTHMHKLSIDIEEINKEACEAKAFSLIVHNEGEKRSYKIEVAPPQGKSYASDIAKKYGVTYELLLDDK